MEQNSANRTANRGDRKPSTTLMVWGDQEAIVCPWYLHVQNGHIKGLLYRRLEHPAHFEVPIREFCAGTLSAIKA